MKKRFILLLFIPSFIFSQVGIGIDKPTHTLDVNGDIRVRGIEDSTEDDDINLVVDKEGVFKKSTTPVTNSIFKGYLSQDFVSKNSATDIYKLENYTIIDNSKNILNTENNVFTINAKGLYRITLTLTLRISTEFARNNVNVGILDNTNKQWIARFGIDKPNLTGNVTGNAYTFIGLVYLEENQQVYFGITGYTNVLAFPTYSTGDGIGTYFDIELIKKE